MLRYGRIGLTISNVQCSLHLCSKKEIVVNELMNLPVKYLRVFAETEEEFHLLLKGSQTFKSMCFPMEDGEIPQPALAPQQPPLSP